MRVKNEVYTCVGFLLLLLAVGLYLVWYYYGSWPFVLGGAFVGIFVIWIIYNNRKAKHAPKEPPQSKTFENVQQRIAEELEKEQQAKGLTKYTDQDGNTQWGVPEQVAEWAKARKVDVVIQKDHVEIEFQKEGAKIRCPYCGTLNDEELGKCPNCGARP
jgi:rubrerythrin